MKRRIVYRRSVLPASKTRVFALLQQLSTLRYIASPYATFEPINEPSDFFWEVGKTFAFRFKLFGIVPFGTHTIHVLEFDENHIYTHEANTYVPVWNHRIVLKEVNDQEVMYSDEVELYAGWKTPFVYLWASAFYRHRQRRWVKLLNHK